MNAVGEAIGELCKIILPIREEFYLGNPDSHIAICTLLHGTARHPRLRRLERHLNTDRACKII